ncbi:MAG: hypothetical protein R2751_06315 [Bacteroidales bacterium]
MEDQVKIPRLLYIVSGLLVLLGSVAVVLAFRLDGTRAWANLLLNNVYFVSLAGGALLFLSIQRVTHSGWSAGFLRVPEAMAAFLPVSAVLFLLMIPGLPSLYHWAHPGAAEHDALLAHKAPYLNQGFWIARMAFYFLLWNLMFFLLRRVSLREDRDGGMAWFRKGEHLAKITIFLFIITFSFAMIDWVMSIDAHWYSTIFAIRNFVAAFHHASIVIAFIVLIMHTRGYFPF